MLEENLSIDELLALLKGLKDKHGGDILTTVSDVSYVGTDGLSKPYVDLSR